MDISFIIPAYNASKTINRAIDSILNQKSNSLKWEIIVVDDGSSDEIENVINGKEDRYPSNTTTWKKESSTFPHCQIQLYKKENGGVSSARNFGVNKAKGKYIIFVDSDDYISKTLLSDIEKYILENKDLIKWNPIIVNNSGEIVEETVQDTYLECTGEEGFNSLFGKDPLLDCLWNYAIKKELVHEFPQGKYHEDFATMPLVILSAKQMIITGKKEYYYVQTESSIMRGNTKQKERKKLEDKLEHFDNLIEQANQMDLNKETKENIGIFAVNSLIVIKDLNKENEIFLKQELKKRKIWKYIKARNVKQFVKKIFLFLKYVIGQL